MRTPLFVLIACLLCAARAEAHDVRGELAFLDIGDRVVELQLEVPMFQLAVARAQTLEQLQAEPMARLVDDARAHVALYARDGRSFALTVRRAEFDHDGQAVRFLMRATPPAGAPARWFTFADDLVLHTVVNANVYVFLRRDLQSGALGEAPTLIGTLHYQQRDLVVDRTAGTWRASVAATFWLGVAHIRDGTDHLMFLLVLLVVAPLAGPGWRTSTTARRGLVRTARIATAFTLGHSLTLALGAIFQPALPVRVVESAIAVSILVSALHAWRPMFAGKEPVIAGAFGLVHGLAFATALAGFGYDRPSLVLALLGFNLGVEAMQLLVIALTVPSLLVLARHPAYRWLRLAAAAIAGAAALLWLYERAFDASLALSTYIDRAAHRATWLALALFALAVASVIAARLRLRSTLVEETP